MAAIWMPTLSSRRPPATATSAQAGLLAFVGEGKAECVGGAGGGRHKLSTGPGVPCGDVTSPGHGGDELAMPFILPLPTGTRVAPLPASVSTLEEFLMTLLKRSH